MKKNECRLGKNYKYSRKSEHCHTETKYFLPQEYLLLDVFCSAQKKPQITRILPRKTRGWIFRSYRGYGEQRIIKPRIPGIPVYLLYHHSLL